MFPVHIGIVKTLSCPEMKEPKLTSVSQVTYLTAEPFSSSLQCSVGTVHHITDGFSLLVGINPVTTTKKDLARGFYYM